jgi:hypothetical protein
MKYLLSAVLLLIFHLSFAQNFNRYTLLKNSGPIPDIFLSSSTEKYKAEIIKMEKDLRARNNKDQKQFYLETNFVVDDLLLSGKVLFGTPLNEYVNNVADKVLEQVPELKGKVQFFILRSPAVNAFATQQGIIFINMGLLAQLESEAQLAFIIAHELSHVKKSHSLNKFLNKKSIDRNISRTQLLKQTDFDETLVSKNKYSKELELEADNDGLSFYKKTNYSLSELDGVFKVLKFAHLLYDVEPFDNSFFNVGTILIPKKYYLDKTNEIKPIDDSNDLISTHPAIDTRLNIIKKLIESEDNSGKSAYLVSAEEFGRVRKIARYELVYYYLHQFRYEDAIYTAFLLSKEDPNSEFLLKSIVQALHGISKYLNAEAKDKEDSDYQRNNTTYQEIEGPQQQIYHLLAKLKNNELTIVALRFAWQVHQQFSENKEVEVLLKDLFIELAFHYEDLSSFKKVSFDEVLLAYQNKGNIQIASDTVKTEVINSSDFDFSKYAFGDIIENKDFVQHFEAGKKEHNRLLERKKYYNSDLGKAELTKYEKRRKRGKIALGIDSVLVLDPYYLKLDARKENAYQYVETESGQKNLLKIIEKCLQASDLNYVILDVNNLNAEDIEAFNDIVLLNEWFSQQTRIGDWTMPGFSQHEVDEIVKKYGTRYVLKTGVVVLRKPISKLRNSILGISAIPLSYVTVFTAFAVGSVAFGIASLAVIGGGLTYLMLKPQYESLHYAVLYDVKDQKYEVLRYDVLKRNDSNALLSSLIYDSLKQIKRKARK